MNCVQIQSQNLRSDEDKINKTYFMLFTQTYFFICEIVNSGTLC